jgi:uncharacterized protein YecT (DUF1311 family)
MPVVTAAGGICLALGLAFTASPVAAQDWNCADFDNLPQQGINACLAQRYAELEARLNETYEVALGVLEPQDEASLRAAQLAWTTYRSAACEVEAGAMRGGTGEAMLRFGCLARLTERRLADLDEILAWRNQ